MQNQEVNVSAKTAAKAGAFGFLGVALGSLLVPVVLIIGALFSCFMCSLIGAISDMM